MIDIVVDSPYWTSDYDIFFRVDTLEAHILLLTADITLPFGCHCSDDMSWADWNLGKGGHSVIFPLLFYTNYCSRWLWISSDSTGEEIFKINNLQVDYSLLFCIFNLLAISQSKFEELYTIQSLRLELKATEIKDKGISCIYIKWPNIIRLLYP